MKTEKQIPITIDELRTALDGWDYLSPTQREFLIDFRLLKSNTKACKLIGIHKSTPSRWRQDPKFVALERFFEAAPMLLASAYTDELFIKAIGMLDRCLTEKDVPWRVRVDAAGKSTQLALDIRTHIQEGKELKIKLAKALRREQRDQS